MCECQSTAWWNWFSLSTRWGELNSNSEAWCQVSLLTIISLTCSQVFSHCSTTGLAKVQCLERSPAAYDNTDSYLHPRNCNSNVRNIKELPILFSGHTLAIVLWATLGEVIWMWWQVFLMKVELVTMATTFVSKGIKRICHLKKMTGRLMMNSGQKVDGSVNIGA